MSEVYGYSGINPSIPFLRTGYEYFVPSNITTRISDILHNLARFFCTYKQAYIIHEANKSKKKLKTWTQPPKLTTLKKQETTYLMYQDLFNREIKRFIRPQVLHVPQPSSSPTTAQKRTERIKRIRAAKKAMTLKAQKQGGGKRKTRRRRKKKTRKRRKRRRKTRKR